MSRLQPPEAHVLQLPLQVPLTPRLQPLIQHAMATEVPSSSSSYVDATAGYGVGDRTPSGWHGARGVGGERLRGREGLDADVAGTR